MGGDALRWRWEGWSLEALGEGLAVGNFGLVVDPPCDKIRLDEVLARAGAVVDDPAPVNLGPLLWM